ncbi:MAG: hypothetical protein JJT75_06970 [Opitutales bacterium]|nr:hypothetical protein [Opitutales bacterium]
MTSKNPSRRGAVMLNVLIFGVVLSTVVASLFRLSTAESRYAQMSNYRQNVIFDNRSLLNHGMEQISAQLVANPDISDFHLESQNRVPLTISSAFKDLYEKTNSKEFLFSNSYSPSDFWNNPENYVSGVTGFLRDKEPMTVEISPDSLLPSILGRFEAELWEFVVFGKATQRHDRYGERSHYNRQSLQVIDRPLYSYAMFYEGDLELFPGATMEVHGPIHSNESIYLGSNSSLQMHQAVSAARDFFSWRKDNPDTFPGGDVFLRDLAEEGSDPSDYLENIRDGDGWSGVLDSDTNNFRNLALETLNGGLRTREHGVRRLDFPGFAQLQNLFPGASNHNHFLIQPVSPSQSFDYHDLNSSQKAILSIVEREKWAYQADMVFRLRWGDLDPDDFHPGDDSTWPHLDLLRYVRQGDGIYFFDSDNYTDDPYDGYFSEGQPIYKILWSSDGDNVVGFDLEAEGIVERQPYSDVGGLYDWRQGGGSSSSADGQINLVRFDMGKFREWLEDEFYDFLNGDLGDIADFEDTEAGDVSFGNRIETVYFEIFGPEPPESDDGFQLAPAAPALWALQIHNGRTCPSGQFGSSSNFNSNLPIGMTFATNASMYVKEHFNSPLLSGNSRDPDNANFGSFGEEMPIALVADAISLLSGNFDNVDNRNSNLSSAVRRAVDTTVSAALVTGNVPTPGVGGQYSGGVENFPRLLEDWSGRTLTIRGALINLFESESHTAPMGSSNVYNPPSRNWGFHSRFPETPPRPTPVFRTLRRIAFQELTGDEFYEQLKEVRSGNRDI